MLRVVLDTNVFVTALRSQRGAGFRLLSRLDGGTYCPILSVPLVLEYEEVAKRQARVLGLTHADIDDVLDYICRVGELRRIFFLWRPVLPDPRDDMVLELAVEAQADAIITYNRRDFTAAHSFGLEVLTPQEVIQRLEGL